MKESFYDTFLNRSLINVPVSTALRKKDVSLTARRYHDIHKCGRPVVVAFRFRTMAPQDGHTFHLAIDRPTKGLDVELSYDSADIATMRMMDFASRDDGGRMSEEPEHAAVRYRYNG